MTDIQLEIEGAEAAEALTRSTARPPNGSRHAKAAPKPNPNHHQAPGFEYCHQLTG